MISQDDKPSVELTATIVSAYVSNNRVELSDLAGVIRSVFDTLGALSKGETIPQNRVNLIPAVPIKRSIQPDYIVSLEDGRRLKSMKRYLRARYGMTPDQYREKWGLPKDYPMVAPSYSAARSKMAIETGLGATGRRTRQQVKVKAKR